MEKAENVLQTELKRCGTTMASLEYVVNICCNNMKGSEPVNEAAPAVFETVRKNTGN